MSNLLLQYAIPVFFVLIFIEALYARVKGLQLYNLRNSLSCLGCGIFTTSLEVFTKAALLALYSWVYEHLAWVKLDDGSWVTWITGLLVFDFIWYWAHRISHEVNVLWGGHVPHHQSEEFNLTTGLRQGALQDLMYWPLYLLMAPLGYSADMFIAQLLINKFYGFWLHTRTIGQLPLVEGILSTPSAHRVHHGMNDRYINKNYGGILIVFDRLFGTYQKEDETVIFGVRKRYASYNPVWAHFDWLYSIGQDAMRAERGWDKIRIWFMPTGWRPRDVAEKYPRQKLSMAGYVKFDANPGKYPVSSVLALFLMLAVANQVMLFQSESLSWGTKGGLLVVLTLGLCWLGRLLNESKRKFSSVD